MDATPLKPPTFPLFTLLRYRCTALKNTLRGVHRESHLKLGVVSVTGLIFWAGLFWLFMDGFNSVNTHAGLFRTALTHYGLSVFFLALVVMLIFSNTLISFSNLFRSNETAFLFSTPVPRHTIFLYKLLESMLFSSWAVLALGLPLLLALGIQSGADWAFYPLAVVMMLPFVALPAGIGAALGLLLTAYLPRVKGRLLIAAGLVVLILAAYVGMGILNTRLNVYGRNMDVMVQSVLGKLSFARYYMTPSYWMTEGLLSVSEGQTDKVRVCGIFFAALASTALFAVSFGWFMAGTLYSRTFSDAHGLGGGTRLARRTLLEFLMEPLLRRRPQMGVLLLKDLKTFFRDPAQWAQVLIFFGILLIYNGNLRNMSFPLEMPFYKNLTSFLNLSAASMTLATICSRFIFPLISMEGQRFWILGLAPISRREVMWSKFYFSAGGTLFLSVPLILLSNWVLENSPLVFAIQIWTSVLIPLSLSGLSVGMGALFPNFHERSPSKIVSGFGGTLTLILSVGLVVFSVGGGGYLCHRFLVLPQIEPNLWQPQSAATWAVPFIAAITALNLTAAWLPMKLGIRALERTEF